MNSDKNKSPQMENKEEAVNQEVRETIDLISDQEVGLKSRKKTFAEAIVNEVSKEEVHQRGIEEDSIPLKPLLKPRFFVGNVVVEVDDEDYYRGVEEFSVIGKLLLHRGDQVPTMLEMKKKTRRWIEDY